MNIYIRTFLYTCFLASILTGSIVKASDLQQQQSTLYPFRSFIEMQEEFLSSNATSGTIGALGWFTAGGSNSQITGETNAPGIIRRDTSAVSGTVACLLLSGTQNQINSTHSTIYVWRVRLNTNDANTTARIGSGNGFTVSPTGAGVYFEKADADTNWFAVARQAGSETRVDTGVAVSTNFAVFVIQKLPGSAIYSVNGSTPVSISTNLPVSGIQPVTQIVNSAAAAKTLDHDYFQMQVSGITR